jgi:hypothetical protein
VLFKTGIIIYSDWQGQQGVGAAFTWHHYQKIRGDIGELRGGKTNSKLQIFVNDLAEIQHVCGVYNGEA